MLDIEANRDHAALASRWLEANLKGICASLEDRRMDFKKIFTKVKKVIAVLISIAMDKHLDYDEDEIKEDEFKKER